MSLEAAAATGTGLSGVFEFAATHSAVFIGITALGLATGFDLHSAAAGIMEPMLGG